MRNFKIIVWVLAIYIIQCTFGSVFMIGGTAADLILAFLVTYSFFERKMSRIFYVMIAGAVLNGSGVGRVFPVAVLATGFASLLSHGAYNYFRMIPAFLRIVVMTLASAFVMFGAESVLSGNFAFSEVIAGGCVHAVYTAVICGIIYPIVKCTLFKTQEKQTYKIQERI